MSDRPTHVDVGPWRLEVIVDRSAIDRAGQEGRRILTGSYQPRDGHVLIEPDLPHDLEVETLVHELLHALLDLTAMGSASNDDGDGAVLRPDTEELVVRALSPALLDMLRRNADLVAYLLAR